MTRLNDKADPLLNGYWDGDAIASRLMLRRQEWRSEKYRHREYGAQGFPSRPVIGKVATALASTLYPLRLGPDFVRRDNEDAYVRGTLDTGLSRLYGQIRLELGYAYPAEDVAQVDARAANIIARFADALPDLRALLDTDVEAAFAGDPAARSVDEVLICYPSMQAIIHHRMAHLLYSLGAPLVARIISAVAYAQTGIDIHPGARIGRSFFVDHGSGVVIGETAVVGDRVRLYQGVTLGARGDTASAARGTSDLRHPIVEDDVVIYAGATVLGRVIVGRGSVILGNVWLTESVPAFSLVRQARAAHQVTSRAELSAPHRTGEAHRP